MNLRPQRSDVVAGLALFVALGGTSYAVAKNSIGSREIRDGAVRTQEVRDRSLRGKDVRANSIGTREVAGLRAEDFAGGRLPAGPTGPAGPAGAQGLQGPRGADGAAGAPGGTKHLIELTTTPNSTVLPGKTFATIPGIGELTLTCRTEDDIHAADVFLAAPASHDVDVFGDSTATLTVPADDRRRIAFGTSFTASTRRRTLELLSAGDDATWVHLALRLEPTDAQCEISGAWFEYGATS